MNFFVVLSDSVALFMLWIFIVAGISKLNSANRDFYIEVMRGYGIKLPELAKVIVWIFGSAELMAGILVLFPASRFVGFILGATLLIAYFVAIAFQIVRGKTDADCGCAGPGQSVKTSPILLIRNLVYIGLLSSLWFSPASSFTGTLGSSSSVEALFQPELWLLPLIVALTLVLISSCAENLIANAQNLAKIKQNV